MRRFVICVLTVTYCTLAVAEEFQPLFDGHSLEGWVKRGGAATYEVRDSMIVGRSAPNTPNTFLCTEKRFGDFVLTYEYKCDNELNSGVQIRSECYDKDMIVERPNGKQKKFPAGRVFGYQVEIDPNKPDRLWSGGIYDEGRRGWLFPGPAGGDGAEVTEQGQKIYKPNDWNSVKVICQGDHIQTWLNGEPRADFHDDVSSEGFIGLQVHGVGGRTNPLEVRFRNIKLKES